MQGVAVGIRISVLTLTRAEGAIENFPKGLAKVAHREQATATKSKNRTSTKTVSKQAGAVAIISTNGQTANLVGEQGVLSTGSIPVGV